MIASTGPKLMRRIGIAAFFACVFVLNVWGFAFSQSMGGREEAFQRSAPQLQQTYPVPDPKGMVSDPVRQRLYVASRASNQLIVWDEVSRSTLKSIPVGASPWGVALANDRVFVGNFKIGTISVFDAQTLTKMTDLNLNNSWAAIQCAGGPANVVVNPSTKRVYFALYGAGRVAVVDAATNALIDCLLTASGTSGIAVNPLLNQLYVTNRDAKDLQVFDISVIPGRLVQTIPLGGVPFFVQTNPTTHKVYVTVAYDSSYENAKNLLLYDAGSSGLTFLRSGIIGNTNDGGAIWVGQADGGLYVAATQDNQLQVIDANSLSILQTVPAISPFGIAENPGLGSLYVGNRDASTIQVVSDTLASQITPTFTPTFTSTATITPTWTSTPTVTPTITPTWTSTPTVTPTGVLGPGTYDDMHPSIVYTGTWSLYSGSGPYSDTLHYSDTTGDSAQVKFSGSSIKLVYAANVNNGPVNLAIDGGAPTSLNEYSSSLQWQQQWSSGSLPMGTHTLVLTITSGTRVNVDAFIVEATAPPTSTNTPTATNTATPTNTPTATNTATPTNTPVLPPSSVCVLAYFDWNVNATRDLTESVLAGARITVTGPGGSAVGSLITNGTEPRCFSSLPAGNYTVLEENPAGFADTTAGSVTAPVTTTATTLVAFGDAISRPNGIVSDASRNHLFVASKNTNTVVVLDELTQRVLTTLGVESQPLGLGLVNDRVFVANSRSATVTVIDAASLTKMGTVSLNGHCEGGPMYVAVNPVTKRAYVGLYGVGRVAVIDATTNTLADCLSAGLGTFGVAVNPSLGQLYVTNRDDMSLQVYDISAPPNHLIQTFRVGAVPFFVAANAGSHEVYSMVAFDSPNYAIPSTLEIFNANSSGVSLKAAKVISNTDDGGAVWFSPTNNKLYVAATHDNELLVLDPTSYAALQTIPMTDPFYIAENPGLGRIYVTNRNANAITIH